MYVGGHEQAEEGMDLGDGKEMIDGDERRQSENSLRSVHGHSDLHMVDLLDGHKNPITGTAAANGRRSIFAITLQEFLLLRLHSRRPHAFFLVILNGARMERKLEVIQAVLGGPVGELTVIGFHQRGIFDVLNN